MIPHAIHVTFIERKPCHYVKSWPDTQGKNVLL